MKVKFFHVVFLLSLVSFCLPVRSAGAQDKGLSPNELLEANHSDSNDEKISTTEHESKPKPAGRDSVMVHGKSVMSNSSIQKSRTVEHKSLSSKEEDDALSFNFLYYIIQKFKISDLIDE